MAGYAYPFDSTGLASTNVITAEVHDLANYTNAYRCLIPIAAPFYRDDLLVKHKDTGRILTEGLDFFLGYYYKELSDSTRRGVYGGICFGDTTLVGKVELVRYHTVGGQYLQRKKDIDNWLAGEPMADPRNIDFAAVLKWPRVVEPFDEPTTMQEALVIDPVLRSIDALVNRVEELVAEEKVKFAAVMSAMRPVTKKIVDYKFDGHYYGTDPHENTYIQLNALGKTQTAANAIVAYGKTLAELITLINKIGITPTNVAQYYPLIGGLFEGRLTFNSASTIQIRNTTGMSLIDLSSSQLLISANGNLQQISDADKNESTMGALLEAGNNTLSVHSSGTGKNNNHGLWNGQILIHAGNISQFVTTQQTNATLELVVGSSPEVELTGDGTTADPIQADTSLIQATTAVAGLARLSSVLNANTTTTVVSNEALALAAAQIAKYVPNTRTVGGKALTGNITLDKSVIGLSAVNNTADTDKPVSTAFQAAVADKALVDHDHVWGDLTSVPWATTDDAGIAMLHTSIATGSLTPTNKFLSTRSAAMIYGSSVTPLNAYAVETPQNLSEFPIFEWGKYTPDGKYTPGIYYESITGWVIEFLEFRTIGDTWDYRKSTLDLATVWFADEGTPANRTVYLYMTSSQDLVGVETRTPDSDSMSYIGTVTTNATTVATCTIEPLYRIMNVSELMKHIDSTTAHGNLRYDKVRYGLSNIENKPLVHTVVKPTFADVFNTWYRFSHLSSNPYPAVASEINSWAYNSATDSITTDINSTSYIGFVSNDVIGDYEFDTAVSSTNTDDDSIGIVIGFYKDPTTGKEHTLSLLKVLSRDSASMQWSIRLVYNMLQSDAWDIALEGSKSNYGWSTVGECRLRAIRSGDIYNLEAYGLQVFNGGALEWTRTLDLNSDPRLAVFKGTTRYGYACQSQAFSTFRSITRPDEDLRNQYASEQTVKNLLTSMESSISITTGVVAQGGLIPPPAGFTAAQCTFHLVPRSLSLAVATALEMFECYADATGLATIRGKLVADATWVAGTATYYCIGRK